MLFHSFIPLQIINLKNAQAMCSNTNTICADSLEKPKELVMLEKTALMCTTEHEAS